jgi:hypothetical protein
LFYQARLTILERIEMAEHNAMFGLFASGDASKVFKELGITAQKTSKDTSNLALTVEKASTRMTVAANKEQAAAAKVNIEQTKLNEMRAKGDISASSLMAQEERLAAAQRNSALAVSENAKATTYLAKSEAAANLEATHLNKGFLGLGGSTRTLGSRMASTAKLVGGMAAGFAAFKAFEFGKQSITAAEEFQTANTKLQISIKNTGRSFVDYKKPIAEASDRLGKWGFTAAETETALATMTTGLRNPLKALGLISLAADLARKNNMGLNDSALLLTKAQEGQLRGTHALGIDSGVAASGLLQIKNATLAHAKAVKHLQDLEGKSGAGNYKSTIAAQERLNHLQAQHGNVSNRTISQSAQIAKAQDAVNKSQFRGQASNTALAKAQQAVIDTEAKLNDRLKAGAINIESINKAIGGTAEKMALDDYATKQKVLATSFDAMQVSLGNKLLPVLTGLTDWMNKDGIKDIKAIGGFFHDWGKEIAVVGTALVGFAAGTKILGGISIMTKAFAGLRGAALATAGAEALAGGATAAEAAGIGAGLTIAEAIPGLGLIAGAAVGGGLLVGSFLEHQTKSHFNKAAKKMTPFKPTKSDIKAWEQPTYMSPATPMVPPLTGFSRMNAPHITVHVHGHVTTLPKLAADITPHLKQLVARSGGKNH